MKSPLPILIVSALAIVLNSCSPGTFGILNTPYAFASDADNRDAIAVVSNGSWDVPMGLTGDHRIEIDVDMQNAKYYIAGQQVGFSTVSTGRDGQTTPRRSYKVLSKDIDHRSSKYGHVLDAQGNTIIKAFVNGKDIMPLGGRYEGASMFYGLQLNTTGIWMHEGKVTSAPESAGCIRLPTKMAKHFFENVPVGTPVIVK